MSKCPICRIPSLHLTDHECQEPPDGGSDQRLVRDWSAHNYGTHWLINNSLDETHVEAWGVSETQAHAIRDALIANTPANPPAGSGSANRSE